MSKKNKPSLAQATWLGALSRGPIVHSSSVVEPAVRDSCEARGWTERRVLVVAKDGEVQAWHLTESGRTALLRAAARKSAAKPLRFGTSNALKPAALLAFESELRKEAGEVGVSVDAPAEPAGTWWIDISFGGFQTALSWQEEIGFGVFTSEASYGDKPDELHIEPDAAARRIAQLIAGRAPTGLNLRTLDQVLADLPAGQRAEIEKRAEKLIAEELSLQKPRRH